MKTVSKKLLQKMANKLGVEIHNVSGQIYQLSGEYEAELFAICPELQPGEIIEPREKVDKRLAELKMEIPYDEDREKDVQKIVEHILNTTPDFWDDPNGPYRWHCPFCWAEITGGSESLGEIKGLSNFSHELDCIYLIAKDLHTKDSK